MRCGQGRRLILVLVVVVMMVTPSTPWVVDLARGGAQAR